MWFTNILSYLSNNPIYETSSFQTFFYGLFTLIIASRSNIKEFKNFSEAPNSDCDTAHETTDKVDIKSSHKDSTSIKKEIIGILKPPTLKKELKSFPSLPECFLHDLGLLDNFALR